MNNMNSIILEGNLTKDPVMRSTPKGTAVCHFTVASNRYYKSENERREEVGYFEVEVWSRLAETCDEYLSKGRGVRVVGRLKQNRWTTTEGKPRSKIQIVAEHVEFQPKPKREAGVGEADESASSPDGTEEQVAQPVY